LESGNGTNHDQQPLTAGRTRLAGSDGWAPGVGCLRCWFRSAGRRGGCVPRQAELELVQERTMDGAPEPIIADFVEALGQHMLQKTPDELLGRQGHGLPALVLGVLVTEADLVILDGEQAGVGQRDPMDIPAQVIQDLLRALHGRFAVDDPPLGPDRLGHQQVGPFLPHQHPKPTTKEL